MARPAEIRDEDILEAARSVFLERGVDATTAEVARRAGISEGSIFNRFKTKDELFRAAMETKLDGSPWMQQIEARIGRGEVREQLVEIGLQAIDFFRTILPMVMMNWSNRRVCQAFAEGVEPPPARALRRTAGFFEAEMRAGRLRRFDPQIVARSFLGALINYVFLETTWGERLEPRIPPAAYVRGHVDLLLSGLEPPKRPRAGNRLYPTRREGTPLSEAAAARVRIRRR